MRITLSDYMRQSGLCDTTRTLAAWLIEFEYRRANILLYVYDASGEQIGTVNLIDGLDAYQGVHDAKCQFVLDTEAV